jgi:putative integral membrane protein (TIGR02587 family)
MMPGHKRRSPWQAELDDLLRGVSGAFLFGAPFLYTMEVWWKGNFTSPPRMLFLLALSYVALIALNRAAGFRAQQGEPWRRTFGDSAEALAIGLITATVSLLLLGLITPEMGLEPLMGRIIMESVPFSIGVGIAYELLHEKGNSEDEGKSDNTGSKEKRQTNGGGLWEHTLADMGATALGATIVAFSIAPTDEIPLIATGLSFPWLLGIMVASLLLSYIIVFEAEFGAQSGRLSQPGLFQSPFSETVISYLISLLLAALMLWIFQLLRPDDPLIKWVSYVVVLGLPATIGGAAGRLAL